MTIQQCKYVVEIFKCGSFNEAAKKLFVAQTSLSAAVKALEKELNIRIFDRTSKGVILTDDGAVFVGYANQLVEQSDHIHKLYSAPSKRRYLSVSTQHYDFATQVFALFVNEYCGSELSDKSDFDLSIREIKTYDVINDVETSFCDVGIIAVKDDDSDIMKRFLAGKNIEFHPLYKTAPHVYIKKEHPLSQKSRLSFSDLKEYPYIFYEQGEHNSTWFTEEMYEKEAGGKRIKIADRATLMNLLLVTDGYTVGTGIMTSKLNSGNVTAVPLDGQNDYHIGYLVRGDKRLSSYAERFVEMLTSFFEAL